MRKSRAHDEDEPDQGRRSVEPEEAGGVAQTERPFAMLPPAARELMEVLWDAPKPCTLGAVGERAETRFPARSGRVHTSIHVTLQVLAERGYVEIDTSRSNRFRYRPRVSRGEALAGAAETLVEEFCHYDEGDGWYLVRAFLSRLDLDELVPVRHDGGDPSADRSGDARKPSGSPATASGRGELGSGGAENDSEPRRGRRR